MFSTATASNRNSLPGTMPSSSSSTSRIGHYLADNEVVVDHNAAQRPTEAQLRWSFIHRSEIARETRDRIDRLMKFPPNVSDVEGAHSSDGDTTASEGDETDLSVELRSPSSSSKQSSESESGDARTKSYLGTRQTREGKWVRRHFSQARFPHLAAKSMPSSSSAASRKQKQNSSNDQMGWREVKHPKKLPRKQKRKAVISRGRRALLRVSARACEERKKQFSSFSSRRLENQLSSSNRRLEYQSSSSTRRLEYQSPSSPRRLDYQSPSSPRRLEYQSPSSPRRLEYQSPSSPRRLESLGITSTLYSKQPDPAPVKRAREVEVYRPKATWPNNGDNLDPVTESETAQDTSNNLAFKSSLGEETIENAAGSTRHHWRLFSIDENEERIRRFEEAYKAIMLATNANFQFDDANDITTRWLDAGGKRWARDPHISSAMSIDGRRYYDLQRAPTVSLKEINSIPDSWLDRVPAHRNLGHFVDAEGNNHYSMADVNLTHGIEGAHAHTPQEMLLQRKLSDIESKIHGVEYEMRSNLYIGKNIQSTAMVGLTPLQCEPMQQIVENTGGESPSLERTRREKSSKVITGNHAERGAIEKSESRKDRSPKDTTPSVRVRTLQKLFATVQGSGPLQCEPMQPMTENARGKSPLLGRIRTEKLPQVRVGNGAERKAISIEKYEQQNECSPKDTTPSVRVRTLHKLFAGVQGSAPLQGEPMQQMVKNSRGKSLPLDRIRREKPPKVLADYDAEHGAVEKSEPRKEPSPKAVEKSEPRKESSPKYTTPNVQIRTLQKLFAGVQDDTKNPSEPKRTGDKPNHAMLRKKGFVNRYKQISSPSGGSAAIKENEATRNEMGSVHIGSHGFDAKESTAEEIYDTKSNTLHEKMDTVNSFLDNDSRVANHTVREQSRLLHDDSISDQSPVDVSALVKESLAAYMLEPSIIDTDGTEIDYDESEYEARMRSMLMSPSLITKRYQQALNAIEARNWNQFSYLINANPWLMEMKDVRNDQTLVHSLSLFGGGQGSADLQNSEPLPKQLAQSIIDYDPNIVHRLDLDGNLPLHMAAASGNTIMIRELGHQFAGAASVQNHNGLLPLHLAIMSCALIPHGSQSVELVLALFPGAVGVKDNDGNTPLHVAAGTLRGDVGAGVINQLVKGCETLMLNNRALFDDHTAGTKESMSFVGDASILTAPTETSTGIETPTCISRGDDSFVYMAKNKNGETPLVKAIKSFAGRQVVDALLCCSGGQSAVLETNSASQNALHLALLSEFHDAAVVLSLLKSSPSAATIVDGRGRLPIQLACLNSFQHEVILAIAIVDLPIDLGAQHSSYHGREGFGASWWYILCESDDIYVDIVSEILSLCSHPQKIALCLSRSGNRQGSMIAATRATPCCKMELSKSLRFFGRFEFIGERKSHVSSRHVHQFDAIDYGPRENPMANGNKVSLFCYTDEEVYSRDARHLQRSALDPDLFEELSHCSVAGMEANIPSSVLHCVAAEKSSMSLANVVAEMQRKHRYRADTTSRGRYLGKSRSIMRQIAKALSQLHSNNIVHGFVDSIHIGKFGGRWKLSGLPGSVVRGDSFPTSRLGLHSPPEAFVLMHSKDASEKIAALAPSLEADPAVDMWAYGKLLYEVLTGETLFMTFSEDSNQFFALKCIQTWSDGNLSTVSDKLAEEGISSTGVDLISCCLCPISSARPRSMLDIIGHPFWRDKNAFNLI